MKLLDITNDKNGKTEITGIIYAITNIKTGKIYVGQTIHSFSKRYKSSKWWLYSNNKDLKQDHKDFPKNFRVFILESGLSHSELNKQESFYIENLNTLHPNGYNRNSGGNSSLACEETKQKLSEIRIGNYSPQNKKNSNFLGVRYCRIHKKFKCCFENKALKKAKFFESEIEAAETRDIVSLYIYGNKKCVLNFPEKIDKYLSLDLEKEFHEFLSPKKRAGLYRGCIPLPKKNKLIKMLSYMNTSHLCEIFSIKKSNLSVRLHNLDIWPSKISKKITKQKSNIFFKKYYNLYIK